MLRGSMVAFILGLIISQGGKVLPEYFTQCPMNCKFPVWLVGTDTIPSPMWVPGTVTTNPFRWLFPQPWVVFSEANPDKIPCGMLEGDSLQISGFCLYAALSSLKLCPENSSRLSLPGLSTLFSQLNKNAKFHLGTPFCAMAWEPSRGNKLG